MQVVYGKILVTICEIKAIILYDKSCMNVVSKYLTMTPQYPFLFISSVRRCNV